MQPHIYRIGVTVHAPHWTVYVIEGVAIALLFLVIWLIFVNKRR